MQMEHELRSTNDQILDCPASEAFDLCLFDELQLDQEIVDTFVTRA